MAAGSGSIDARTQGGHGDAEATMSWTTIDIPDQTGRTAIVRGANSGIARSPLRAATDPGAYGGQFYGPSKLAGTSGPPLALPWSRRALAEGDQARLWQLSEELSGVVYDI